MTIMEDKFDYFIPSEETRFEFKVENSRFISVAAPVFSVEDAKLLLARMKSEYKNGSHYVSAYIIGYGATVIAHCNDDGEPVGTAGRPALAVLQGSDIGDIGVVVIRYYGGIKLGTGGLVRAYGNAVKEVLKILPKAKCILVKTYQLLIPYSFYNSIKKSIQNQNGRILNEEFTSEIVITADFSIQDSNIFVDDVRKISNGKIKPLEIDSKRKTISIAK